MPFPALLPILSAIGTLLAGAGTAAYGYSTLKGNNDQGGQGGPNNIKSPGLFKGTPGQTQQLPKYNQQQQQFQNNSLQQVIKLLGQQLGGPQAQFPNPSSLDRFNKPFDFGPIKQETLRQFNTEIIPSIAQRFSGMGNNAASSPDFAAQLHGAGSGLAQTLAAMQSNIGREDLSREQGLAERIFGVQNARATLDQTNRLGLLEKLLGIGLTPQNENLYQAAQPSTFQSILPSVLQNLALYGASGGFGAQQQTATPGLGSQANYGLPSQGGRGFANPSLYSAGLQNLQRPF